MEKPTKKQILKIAEEYPSHLSIKIRKNWPSFYQHIKQNFDGKNVSSKLYKYVFGNDIDSCKNPDCTKKTKFLTFSKGYNDYCSQKCNGVVNGKKRYKRAQETLKEKYGVDHPCKMDDHMEKVRATKLERYGDETYVNIEQAIETSNERYGGHGYASSELNSKAKKTTKKRHGDENYNNREKYIRTLENKYGQPIHPNTLKSTIERLENGELGFGSQAYQKWLDDNDIENVSQLELVKNKKKKNKLKKKYKQLINNKKFNEKIVPLFDMEDYTGIEYYKTYPFRCVQCGHEFEDWLNNGNVPRCPECYPKRGSSFVEKEIVYYIQSLLPDDEVIENDRSVLESGELDIYIPSKQIAIEYNGLYWHSEKNGNKDRYYHVSKTEECLEKRIQLVHIFEDEWINSGYIVKSALKHMLGLTEETIYARKCEVDYVTKEVSDDFLMDTHLQGEDNSSVRLGLYYEAELVALMTFGSLRRALGSEPKENHWELVRFATSKHVVGGAGKLLAHFIREYEPKKIVTYADRRWSTGNLYQQLGFEEIHKTRPNYWYIENGNRVHRYSFRKSRLEERLDHFDPELTEWQNMQLNDYDRIWDCGHIRFEWNG